MNVKDLLAPKIKIEKISNFLLRTEQLTLVFRQQPVHCRVCGNGDKDHSNIDPPPILELMEIDSTGNLYPITQANQFLLLKVSLWNEFGTEEIRRVIKTPKEKNILVGDLIKSPEVLKDEFDREGCFFIFPRLSIRSRGYYRLKFSLIDINSFYSIGINSCIKKVNSSNLTIFSQQFQVLPPKSFTGSKLSSKLTIKFKEQGVRLIIKKLRVFEVAPENYVPTVIKTDSGWKSHQKDSGINLGEVHN